MSRRDTHKKLASGYVGSAIELYYNAGAYLRDAVKTLRTNIQFSSIDKEIQTIVTTSVVPHEGKSLVSIFLGIAMAESGKRVLLLECDCRRPMLRSYLKLKTPYSFADILTNEQMKPIDAVVNTPIANLYFLNNVQMINPVELMGSNKFWSTIMLLKQEFDVIILDTPPLGSFIEAAVLGAKADGTMLVFSQGSTEIADAQNVVAQLNKAKANIIGAVLNNVDMSDNQYYNEYYYSGGTRSRRRSRAKTIKRQNDKTPSPTTKDTDIVQDNEES